MRYKKTEICQACAQIKNVCQTCLLGKRDRYHMTVGLNYVNVSHD